MTARHDTAGTPDVARASHAPLVSVVMPCLNEEDAIGICIHKIHAAFAGAGIDGEVVVCDNGSTDRSVEIALAHGARVVHQPARGYGRAYQKGFASANGTYFIMGDADDTYDFSLIPAFLQKLTDEQYEFVTGSRYLDGRTESIPFMHRFIGNPMLTAILNILFRTKYSDVYSGYRAFSRASYELIRPVSPGMEFNLELAINAALARLRVAEIPITLQPRLGDSKLRTFRDGWRSLRMMMLYSPNWLFLMPGLAMLGFGLLAHVVSLTGVVQFGGRPAAGGTGMFGTIFSVLGFQILSLGLHAKTYSWSRRFDRQNASLVRFYDRFTLETGLLTGGALALLGGSALLVQVWAWLRSDFLPLAHPAWVSLAATTLIIGVGIVFSSLFISAMSVAQPDRDA